jgi:hypothetical protein
MARLSNSVCATIRLFAFYLSNGSLSSLCDDILSDDFDFDRLLCEPSMLEAVFAVFANTLEMDETGKVINEHHIHRRVSQFIRSEFDRDYVVEPPFEPWETELHL